MFRISKKKLGKVSNYVKNGCSMLIGFLNVSLRGFIESCKKLEQTELIKKSK